MRQRPSSHHQLMMRRRRPRSPHNPFRDNDRDNNKRRRNLVVIIAASLIVAALLVPVRFFFHRQRTRIQSNTKGISGYNTTFNTIDDHLLERYCYNRQDAMDSSIETKTTPDKLFMAALNERFGSSLDPNRSGAMRVLVVGADDDIKRQMQTLRRDGRFEVDGLEPCPNVYQAMVEEEETATNNNVEFEFLGANLGFSNKGRGGRTRGRRVASRVWNTDLAKFLDVVKTDYLFSLDHVGQYHGVSICNNVPISYSYLYNLFQAVVDYLLVEGGLLLTCQSSQSDDEHNSVDLITSLTSKRTNNNFRVVQKRELYGVNSGRTMVVAGVDVNDPHIGRPSNFSNVLRYHHETSHHDKRHNAVSGKVRKWTDQPDKFLIMMEEKTRVVVPLKLTNYSSDSAKTNTAASDYGIKLLDLSRFLQDAFGITAFKVRGKSRWSVRSHPSSGGLQTSEVYVLGTSVESINQAKNTSHVNSSPSCRYIWHYNSFYHVLQKRGVLPSQSVWERTFARVANVASLGKDNCGIVFVVFTSNYWRNSWKYGEPGYWKSNLDSGHALGSAAAAARVQGFRALVIDTVDDDFLSGILGLDKITGDGQGKCQNTSFRVNAQHPVGLMAIIPEDWFNDETVDNSSKLELAIASMDGFTSGGSILNKTQFYHEDEILHPIPPTEETVANSYCASYKSRGNSLANETTSHYQQQNNYGSFWEEKKHMPLSKAITERRTAKTYSFDKSLMRLNDFLDVMSCLKTGCGIAPHLPWKPAVHVLLFVHSVEMLPPGLYLLDRSTHPGHSSKLHEALRYVLPNKDRNKPRLASDVVKGGLKSHEDLTNSFYFVAGDFDTRRVAQLLSREQDIARDGTFTVSFLGDLDHSILRELPHFYRYVHWEAAALGHQLYLMAEALGFRGSGIGSFYSSMVRHFAFGDAGFSNEECPYLPVYHFTFGMADFDARIDKHEPYSFLEKLRREGGDMKAMKTTAGY